MPGFFVIEICRHAQDAVFGRKAFAQHTPQAVQGGIQPRHVEHGLPAATAAIAAVSSFFGGLWTDRNDYPTLRASKLASGAITTEDADRLDGWRAEGFFKVDNAIDPALIDEYLNAVAALKSRSPSPLLVTSISLPRPTPYSPEVLEKSYSARTVDDYFHLEDARRLLFHPVITDFLRLVFERSPVLTQSLNFERGSEQAIHQDTAFVCMNAPMKLIGVWIALEDVKPGAGELVYYPGSHRWPDYLFSNYFRHYNAERDGEAQLQHWYRWIEEEAARQGVQRQAFLPRKGDLLFWHAALAHGGAQIGNPHATRRSLVGHYCPTGVRPLYHYYKPAQFRRHRWRDYYYCSSYYR
ncbi:MAG: phytanoyl-CoA dioxygenase family protein [Halioglobus sp.]